MGSRCSFTHWFLFFQQSNHKLFNVLNLTLLKSISNLSDLSYVHISGTKNNNNATSLPKGIILNLTSLYSLIIGRFSNLQALPKDMFNGITTLEALAIEFYLLLKCLWEGIFQNYCHLKHITIKGCKTLNFFYLKVFKTSFPFNLWSLKDCPELKSFPYSLNHLSSLINLSMLGQSFSLSANIFIIYTDQHIQQLTNLKKLTIEDCPQLKK